MPMPGYKSQEKKKKEEDSDWKWMKLGKELFSVKVSVKLGVVLKTQMTMFKSWGKSCSSHLPQTTRQLWHPEAGVAMPPGAPGQGQGNGDAAWETPLTGWLIRKKQ